MIVKKIAAALKAAGFAEDLGRRRRINCRGTNIYLTDGGVISVYDRGTICISGNAPSEVYAWYKQTLEPLNNAIRAKKSVPAVAKIETDEDFVCSDEIVDSVRISDFPDMPASVDDHRLVAYTPAPGECPAPSQVDITYPKTESQKLQPADIDDGSEW